MELRLAVENVQSGPPLDVPLVAPLHPVRDEERLHCLPLQTAVELVRDFHFVICLSHGVVLVGFLAMVMQDIARLSLTEPLQVIHSSPETSFSRFSKIFGVFAFGLALPT